MCKMTHGDVLATLYPTAGAWVRRYLELMPAVDQRRAVHYIQRTVRSDYWQAVLLAEGKYTPLFTNMLRDAPRDIYLEIYQLMTTLYFDTLLGKELEAMETPTAGV